jgi:nucleotide-binding universal stress UspA family protein
MTTHTYRGWKKIFFGDVFNQIIKNCGIPLLVINPIETAR